MKTNNNTEELEKFNSYEVAEQTFLSWIQTGLALIGFGFGIGSLIAFMQAEHYERIVIKMIRIIGQLLICVGFLTVILALMQHKRKIQNIQKNSLHTPSHNLSLFIGIMISILGIAAFITILIHILF
jgi:putative membrane protein